MFKQCCGCKKIKKDKDDGDSVAVEKTGDNKDQTTDNNKIVADSPPPVVNKSANEEVKSAATNDGNKKELEVNENAEDAETVEEPAAAVKEDASKKKDPGLTIDIKTECDATINEEDEDSEVIPITPRTAKGLTPYPVKRNSTPGLSAIPKWLSQDDEEETGGTAEPPVTPVGRDELALRRHRFFSDLLVAAQAATEHRVRFDPLGPSVAGFSHLHLRNTL